MNQPSLEKWFSDLKNILETSYLSSEEPWKQSGFSGPEERWVACRRPVADCIDSSGSFLDIGCANGYLLECLMRWVGERDITMVPYGLDLSSKLVALARERLSEYTENFFVGNGLFWNPPKKFDYVRTELCYVPDELREEYIVHLNEEFLAKQGKLLVAEYRSRKEDKERPWQDEFLKKIGCTIEGIRSGTWKGKTLTRIAIVKR